VEHIKGEGTALFSGGGGMTRRLLPRKDFLRVEIALNAKAKTPSITLQSTWTSGSR